MLLVVLMLFVLSVFLPLYFVIAHDPRPFDESPRHSLICAAHSDDCVIMGAEYAYGVLQHGLTVRIVYLTCSGPNPDAEISKTRRCEAAAAWAGFGVPLENLSFLELNNSPLSGPPSYSHEDLELARGRLRNIIDSLPGESAVIVPAEGESHVDHRSLRDITLQAVSSLNRSDIVVYETPEYNQYLSMVHSPRRTVRTILRHLPLMNKVLPPYVGPASFVSGNAGFSFTDTPKRLHKKRELLEYFPSQNVKLLLKHFGHVTRYRRLIPESDAVPRGRTTWIPAFGCRADSSVLVYAFVICVLVFLTCFEGTVLIASVAGQHLQADVLLFTLSILGFLTYVIRWIRGTAALETLLIAASGALGIALGGLL